MHANVNWKFLVETYYATNFYLFLLSVIEMLNSDSNFMSYGLWVTTIGCVCTAILFAVFSAVFALINTATTPVEAITGIPGLYLWNACARKEQVPIISVFVSIKECKKQ